MSLKSVQEIVAETKSSIPCVTAEAAGEVREQNSDALFIDVREPGEVEKKRAEGTINIPRGLLEMKITDYTTNPDCPIYVHCGSGGRASLSAAALQRMGFTNVNVIDADCDDIIGELGAP
jgi:rhodanese-related sulfurtransferase